MTNENLKKYWDVNCRKYNTYWVTQNNSITFKSDDLWKFIQDYINDTIMSDSQKKDLLIDDIKRYVHKECGMYDLSEIDEILNHYLESINKQNC